MTRILTDNQRLVRDMAREFSQTEVAKKTAEGYAVYAQTGVAPFGFGLWGQMAELGFAGLRVPEEHSGMGMGMVEEMLVLEEISKVNASAATNIDAHNLAMNTILHSGSDEQRAKYLAAAAQGTLLCAAAVTDPAGSSNFEEWSTTAVQDGDSYVLNGTKHYVSNSDAAGLYAVFTQASEPGHGPLDCYLVEAGTTGLSTGHLEVFGKTGTNTGTIELTDVRVPKANKIPPGDLFFADWLAMGYLDFSAIMLGTTEAAFARTVEFTKQRTRKGKPLAHNQAVAHRLANMSMQIEQVRSIGYDAAELLDAGQMDRKLNSIAKIAASEMISSVSLQCVTLHGAAGIDPATGVYGAYAGAPASWVGEYPNDLHRDMIAHALGIALPSLG